MRHFAKSKPSTSTENACRLLFPLCSAQWLRTTVLLYFPPFSVLSRFVSLSVTDDTWTTLCVLVVILRPYLHMPILHCLWWKYLQCVTDTQNSFFCRLKGYRWTTHHCLSIPEGKSYKRWHVLYQSIETFCWGGGLMPVMISSLVIAHFGEVLKYSVSQFSVQRWFQIFKTCSWSWNIFFFCTAFLTTVPAFNGIVQCWEHVVNSQCW